MGTNHQNIKGILTKALMSIHPEASVLLFGSQVLGMANDLSDCDIVILTQKKLSGKVLNEIVRKLKRLKINSYIFSTQAFNQDRNHSFIEAAPFESARRYGMQIMGKPIKFHKMEDDEFVNAMLILALTSTANWKPYKQQYSLIKEFTRSSILLWHLEGKIPLECTYSIGHFFLWLMDRDNNLSSDPLWKYLEKTLITLRWLDSTLAQSLGNDEVTAWSRVLLQRFEKFQFRLNSLKFRSVSDEAFKLQKDHILLKDVQWLEDNMGTKTMKDSGIQFIMNLLSLVRKTKAV